MLGIAALKWLHHKPISVIVHCKSRAERAMAALQANAYTFHHDVQAKCVTITVNKQESTQSYTHTVSYVGGVRRFGDDSSRGPWLGCSCQDHVNYCLPCKHMSAIWHVYMDLPFGWHTMPPGYFNSPSMSLSITPRCFDNPQ